MKNPSDGPDKGMDASAQPESSPRDDSTAALGRELLSRLLDDSNAHGAVGGEVSSAERETILRVGQRFRGQPLSLSPVTVDLVRAALDGWLGDSARARQFAARAAERIATTLYDDPESNRRLNQLWATISQTTEGLAT